MNARPRHPSAGSGAWLRRAVLLAVVLSALVAPAFIASQAQAQVQETGPEVPGELVTSAGVEEPRREPLHPVLLTVAAVLMVGAAAIGLRITLRGWREEKGRRRRRHRHQRAGPA